MLNKFKQFLRKSFVVQNNVMCGQCVNSLVRVQYKYTGFLIGAGWCKGYHGTRIGLFAPRKYLNDNGYKCYKCDGFYFYPWFAKHVAISQLNPTYVKIMNVLSFDNY